MGPLEIAPGDTSSTVANVLLVDKDLDNAELGGEITWTEPSDVQQVTFYGVYLQGHQLIRWLYRNLRFRLRFGSL